MRKQWVSPTPGRGQQPATLSQACWLVPSLGFLPSDRLPSSREEKGVKRRPRGTEEGTLQSRALDLLREAAGKLHRRVIPAELCGEGLLPHPRQAGGKPLCLQRPALARAPTCACPDTQRQTGAHAWAEATEGRDEAGVCVALCLFSPLRVTVLRDAWGLACHTL